MEVIVRQSLLSGILVGIGVLINTISSDKVVGSMLFSLALLAIIQNGLKLYTGKIGYIKTEGLKNLAVMLVGNLVGIALIVMLVLSQRPELRETMTAAAAVKFSSSAGALFVYGILCGILMFIAVCSKQMLITVFCIMTFILSGYDHCIADFPYLLLNFDVPNLLKFLCVVLGNSVGSIGIWFLTLSEPVWQKKRSDQIQKKRRNEQ